MEIGEIISQAFKYPLSDINAFLKVDILFLILAIPAIISILGIFAQSSSVLGIGAILGIICYVIFALIFAGYTVSVMKEGINQSGVIPSFDIGSNIVNSIKLWVLSFVYGIIPGIIIFIVTFLVTPSTPTNMNALNTSMAIIFIVGIILAIVFGLLLFVGILRFANTGSLSEGLSFSSVIEDIKAIGVGKLIITYIILAIIASVIITVGVFIAIIPIIGQLIFLLLILPFTSLALQYGFGLLYSEIA